MKMLVLIYMVLCSMSAYSVRWKKQLRADGGLDALIHNAILDFTHTSKYFKKDSIFDVTLGQCPDDGIIKVTIIGNSQKKILWEHHMVGTNNHTFPTDYMVVRNKLFLWSHPSHVVSQEIIDVLKRYDHLDSTYLKEGWCESVFDDGTVGKQYYFCPTNYKNYKTTPTNSLLGSYEKPKMTCDSIVRYDVDSLPIATFYGYRTGGKVDSAFYYMEGRRRVKAEYQILPHKWSYDSVQRYCARRFVEELGENIYSTIVHAYVLYKNFKIHEIRIMDKFGTEDMECDSIAKKVLGELENVCILPAYNDKIPIFMWMPLKCFVLSGYYYTPWDYPEWEFPEEVKVKGRKRDFVGTR